MYHLQTIHSESVIPVNVGFHSSKSRRCMNQRQLILVIGVFVTLVHQSQSQCPPGTYLDSGTCRTCPVGYISNVENSAQCTICGPGTYSKGGVECAPCPIGTYATQAGAEICLPCGQGTIAPVEGSTQCVLCPANYRTVSSALCMPCPSGHYANVTSGVCYPCPAGTHFDQTQGCVPCEKGTHAPYSGFSTCKFCPAGQYASGIGSVECRDCPTGQITTGNEPAEICIVCDVGKSTRRPGSAVCEYISTDQDTRPTTPEILAILGTMAALCIVLVTAIICFTRKAKEAGDKS